MTMSSQIYQETIKYLHGCRSRGKMLPVDAYCYNIQNWLLTLPNIKNSSVIPVSDESFVIKYEYGDFRHEHTYNIILASCTRANSECIDKVKYDAYERAMRGI